MEMLKGFLRNTRIPLRLRKKLGKITPVREGQNFAVRIFESAYEGVTGNHLDNKTFLYGMHEPASIRFMRGTLNAQRAAGKTPVYFDVGTNTGAHLLGVATRADRAFGFEPWAPVRNRALANLALNPLSQTTIFDYGLGANEACIPFAPPVAGNHGTGSFYRRDEHSSEVLQVRAGDNVVRELNAAPTLIKIDTEGFENAILEGFAQTLRTAKPVVVFEYSAMSKVQLAADGHLTKLFGPDYAFYGLKPSRELPKIEAFRPNRRYENLIAWPMGSVPIEAAIAN